jgi:hypothetical protein
MNIAAPGGRRPRASDHAQQPEHQDDNQDSAKSDIIAHSSAFVSNDNFRDGRRVPIITPTGLGIILPVCKARDLLDFRAFTSK